MGVALSALFARDGIRKHLDKLDVLAEAEDAPLPLDAGDDAIYQAADAAARHCYAVSDRLMMVDAILDAIRQECGRRGVSEPQGETNSERIARAVDRGWWMRAIRKAHARRFEHAAIRLGFTSYRTGPYLSNESATRQARRNTQNAKLLASIEVQNELGQTYSLAQLAALGTGNKAIRRGELMTRIRGFEEVAQDLRHVGVFATLTCPSKYHGVLSASGEANPKYIAFGSPTPRDAQAYLVGVWARTRAALHRRGIHAYGFRIAEPHHDGCPHWHMLMFVAPEHQETYEAIIRKHALAEDGDEAGAEKNRVKFVSIDPGKGSAAGYIAKYVSKNIDGESVGDHRTVDGYLVVTDLTGEQEITPSQRVTYWSQTWGIRQFQQIGGAPIGVWRELRRIQAETVANAPEAIKGAWEAAQRRDDVQASFADYLRTQGGPTVGRNGLVQLAKRLCSIEGRYATYDAGKPCGVFHAKNENKVYESLRYVWTQKRLEALAVAVPWTGVNNCTQFDYPDLQQRFKESTDRLGAAAKNQKISAPAWVDWPEVRRQAKQVEQDSNKFAWRRNNRG
ncbi:replication endonuclease [Noviherbaspirillum sp. CPCC 100848]|uniref:Replication endonuclease n=1 Tax=Noviherbaspirillum album TaxID=3080276 RepID=A0ABU6JH09_9BURK|nr:replication endonuclease [Noviherbaspirillum sp. CPCC 100848]MEC4722949.1 replication endonuclease [Noviherbaspirillum sp. CPCC 100848]